MKLRTFIFSLLFLSASIGGKVYAENIPEEYYFTNENTSRLEEKIYLKGEYIPLKLDSFSMILKTTQKPPQNEPEKTTAIFHGEGTQQNDYVGGYWTLEPDYRFVDLWTKRGKVYFPQVGRKESPYIGGVLNVFYPYFLGGYAYFAYCRVGKLPSFLTTKEPQEGQTWDYSIEDWSDNPVQPEPTELSKYQLPLELDRFLKEKIELISGSTGAITANAKDIDDLKAEIEAVQPNTEKIEALQELLNLGDNPIFPNNLLKVLNEGTVFLSEFIETKNKKRYKYLLDDGVYADTAAFFIDGDIRENLRIFIGSEDGRCKLSFSKKQFDSLNKKMLINLSDAFVEWKTFE